jgi:hypothetical protein
MFIISLNIKNIVINFGVKKQNIWDYRGSHNSDQFLTVVTRTTNMSKRKGRDKNIKDKGMNSSVQAVLDQHYSNPLKTPNFL